MISFSTHFARVGHYQENTDMDREQRDDTLIVQNILRVFITFFEKLPSLPPHIMNYLPVKKYTSRLGEFQVIILLYRNIKAQECLT